MAVLPISEKYADYAQLVFDTLKEKNISGYIDNRDEKIGRKIRDAEVKKVPFMLIVGEKEKESKEISIRRHGEGDLGSFTIDGFAELFRKEASLF